jgi:DedD protein
VPLPGQDQQPVKVIVLDRDRTEPVPSTADSQPAAAQPAATLATEPTTVAEAAQTGEPETESVPNEPPANKPALAKADEPGTEPEPEQQPAPTIQRTTTSATGMYAVQLGSFSSAENANRLAADLRQEGFAAFLSKTESGGQELHRVRIGPQKDRPAAEAMAARLKDAGHSGQVVPHP